MSLLSLCLSACGSTGSATSTDDDEPVELLVLAAITWAVMLSAGADVLGFSREVGAFVAGVSLASTAYREAIGARLVSLRDFLLVFFFITMNRNSLLFNNKTRCRLGVIE